MGRGNAFGKRKKRGGGEVPPPPPPPPPPPNEAPTPGLVHSVGNGVLAFASTASDPEGGALTHLVELRQGTTVLAQRTTASGVFGSPTAPLSGTYSLRHVVTDPQGASASITYTGIAVAYEAPPAPAPNQPPVAVLAAPVVGDGVVSYNSSASFDPDGSIASRAVVLRQNGVAVAGQPVRTTATGQFGNALSGSDFTIHLTVTDSSGATASIESAPFAIAHTPSGSALLSRHDFNDGTFDGLGVWMAGRTHMGASVIDDPTGSGRGKVVRLNYAYNGPEDGHIDANGGLYAQPKMLDGRTPSWGDRWYFEGEFWLAAYPFGAPVDASHDQRKLLYIKWGDLNTGGQVVTSNIVPVAWGRFNKSGMDLALASGIYQTGIRQTEYGLAPLTFEQWHKLGLDVQNNTRGNADGWLRLYLDDVLIHERLNLHVFNTVPSAPATERIGEFGIGNQEQWGDGSIMRNYRLWDNIEFRTARP